MNKKIISERITKALKDSGMKQRELAQKANITESSVSHYVNGRFAPSPEVGERLAKILKVNVGWLLGLDEAEQQGKFYHAQRYFHETDAVEALFAASGWTCEDILGDDELIDYTTDGEPIFTQEILAVKLTNGSQSFTIPFEDYMEIKDVVLEAFKNKFFDIVTKNLSTLSEEKSEGDHNA